MKSNNIKISKKNNGFLITLLVSFIIVIIIGIYQLYLRFIPYSVIYYNGYAVSGKEISEGLALDTFDAVQNVKALKVNENDVIYRKLKTYYVGEDKTKNINIDYPIYVNNSLAICNLTNDDTLITADFEEVKGGKDDFTLSSGTLYYTSNLEKKDDVNYIFLKNSYGYFINTNEVEIKTFNNNYTINKNSIINFTKDFITYYTLNDDKFVYNKIIDIDYNSDVKIKNTDIDVNYKEFLTKLNIIKAEEKNENNVVENEVTNLNVESNNENKNSENVSKNVVVESKNKDVEITNIKSDEKRIVEKKSENNEEDNLSNNQFGTTWIKPVVECENFNVKTYSARAKVKIEDPSDAIEKAITFSFYIDNNIVRRATISSSGEVVVKNLLPNTKYKIVGAYRYRNEKGDLIENTCLEQEITTDGTENINPIEMSIKNGNVYSDRIELNEVKITSDINDEAINGISNIYVYINDEKMIPGGSFVQNLVSGQNVKYYSANTLQSNSKYNYKFEFVDSAGNIMKTTNNTGSANTCKKIPSVKTKVYIKSVNDVVANITVDNTDNVNLNNYNYILYSSTGDIVKQDNLSVNDSNLSFDDLEPKNTYNIKFFADYDINDGNGIQKQEEIGSATFVTMSIDKLGSLILNTKYDAESDVDCYSLNLTTGINKDRTDERLINILKDVDYQVLDSNNKIVSEKKFDDVNELLNDDGTKICFSGLNSNTEYKINITAEAKQGTTVESVKTSFTTKKFTTDKLAAKLNVKNQVATTSLIDMDVYIEDVDNACIDKTVNIILKDSAGNEYLPSMEPNTIESNEKIPTNSYVRLTYDGLKKDTTYTLTCVSSAYNIKPDSKSVKNNYVVGETQIVTSGLGGTIGLNGLERVKDDNSTNLIDVKSQNNWYSKTFDVMSKSYLNAQGDQEFSVNSVYDYGKSYDEKENALTLTSNQCYVYDLGDYVGQTITLSCKLKVSDASAEVYLQSGKDIGNNIKRIDGIKSDSYFDYKETLTVPKDGYVGFYLKKLVKHEINEDTNEDKETVVKYNLVVKEIQAELGSNKSNYVPFNYKLLTIAKINFIDANNLTYDKNSNAGKYYIRILTDTGEKQEYSYDYIGNDEIEKVENYLINEDGKDKKYTIQLLIKQYDREYVLDYIEFNYNKNCYEIKCISNEEEFKEIQPYGNYIILSDLNLTNGQTESEFTFGNEDILFFGSIDFNGKTIKKDTYSTTKGKETTSYMFYKIAKDAIIKNIVVDFSINNVYDRFTTKVNGFDKYVDEKDGIYSLFLYNNGTVDNAIINLVQCTEKQRINVALMGYRNSGTVNKFIVNYKTDLYGSQYIAGLCLYSDGAVQNGYIAGEEEEETYGYDESGNVIRRKKGIRGIQQIAEYSERNIAGVLFEIDGSGIMQNIYDLSTIVIDHCSKTNSYAANIVYNVGYVPEIDEHTGSVVSTKESTAKVSNVYSVEPIYVNSDNNSDCFMVDSDNKSVNIGPNIINKYSNTQVDGSRYFCDVTYASSEYNSKTATTALYEPGVQREILNSNGFNEFIISDSLNNYYPHLDLNYRMPEQKYYEIKINDVEFIDVLSAKEIKQDDINKLDMNEEAKSAYDKYLNDNNIDLNDENVKFAELRVYNPSGTIITEAKINYLDSMVIWQKYSKKVSQVYILVHNPSTYVNQYSFDHILGENSYGTKISSTYGENEKLGIRNIDISFIKHISKIEDWAKINEQDENQVSGLIQNYRIVEDLDFSGSTVSPYITGKFTGFIDGEYNNKIHTLKNIDGNNSVFDSIDDCTIKNLNVDGLTIKNSNSYVGFIGKADINENITIDNIHINNMEIESGYNGNTPNIGGIIGYISSDYLSKADKIILQNSSINTLSIYMKDTKVTNIDVGGIIGSIYTVGGVDSYITNDYVYNLTFETKVNSVRGVGGIVGYKNHNVDTTRKAGSPNFYVKNCYTTGKINTQTRTGGILGGTRGGNIEITQCFSTVNIYSPITSGQAYIGGIAGENGNAPQKIQKCLYLGNVYVSGNNVGNVTRILGQNVGTVGYSNYAYKDQLVNGEIITNTLGATKLLSEDEIFKDDTFKNLLGFGDNYSYIIQKDGNDYNLIANQYMPQLNDTNKKLIPNQKLVRLDNDLKLVSITSNPSYDKTYVTVTMVFENPKGYEIKKVDIENDDMSVDYDSWSTSTDAKNYTTVSFIAKPNRAYDSYKISTIYYKANGQEIPKELNTKIKVELYKEISNAQEWNDFFSENGSGRQYSGQNIKIKGDIDFSKVDHIEKNVTIGRLEADNKYTFSNINIELDNNSGFINEIKTSMKNLDFKDSEINGKNVNSNGRNNYIGIIEILRAQASNCNFSNIKINAGNGGNCVGVVSFCITGSFNNINLNNISVIGGSDVGALCGTTNSMGTSQKITGTYIKVNASGDRAGGIFGNADGRIDNVQAYQYSADGKKQGDTETEYLVKGNSRVGGEIGNYNSENTVSVLKTTNSKIIGNSFTGGNIGQIYGTSINFTSTNNVINCTYDNVGGNIGFQSWHGSSNATSSNNTITGRSSVGGNLGNQSGGSFTNLTSESNKVSGENYVGGNVGNNSYFNNYLINLRVYGNNVTISGSNYVGGNIGLSYSRVQNIQTQNAKITARGSYVGGCIGSEEYSNNSISQTNNSCYSITGANAKNLKITGSIDNVGGIAGNLNGTAYGTAVEDCTITANRNNAGGIAGYYTGYTGRNSSYISSSSFTLGHSYIVDSEVQATNSTGGVVGNFKFGNIQYCYVENTNVHSTLNRAGGIVGYFDNSQLSNLQYNATIKYNYVANTESDKKIRAERMSAGGIAGVVDKQLNYSDSIPTYNNIECNLIVSDIETGGDYANVGIGSIINGSSAISQAPYMHNIYMYEGSKINGTEVKDIEEQKKSFNIVSADELNQSDFFIKNEQEEDGYTGLNFGNSRYTYSAGYFPLLKTDYCGNLLFWNSATLNINQKKIPLPTSSTVSTQAKVSSAKFMRKNSIAKLQNNVLPKVYVYTVGVDEVNIEFSEVNDNSKFSILCNGEAILENQEIQNRVYTIKYDFNSPIEVKLYNSSFSNDNIFSAIDIQNKITQIDNEYYYLYNGTLNSSKEKISGEYVNVWEDKVLGKDGNIYDILSNNIDQKFDKVMLKNSATPIAESDVNGMNIKTFYHCSYVTDSSGNEAYKEQQIFCKNNNVFMIDGNFANKGNEVIINTFNGNQYLATLGTDGVIYSLLTPINFPENFKNENIIAINNNLNRDTDLMIVYYSTGKVYTFNYVTGKEVDENKENEENVSFKDYAKSMINPTKATYEIKNSDYETSKELQDILEKNPIEEAITKIGENSNLADENTSKESVDSINKNILDKNTINVSENSNLANENVSTGNATLYDKNVTNENSNSSVNINVDKNNDSVNKNTVKENSNLISSNVASDNNNLNNGNQAKEDDGTSSENKLVINNSVNSNSYVISYNPVSKEYNVYGIKDVINATSDETISENQKISGSNALSKYYSGISKQKNRKKNIGITLITIVLIIIGFSLIELYKKRIK